MSDDVALGRRIRTARMSVGMTQTELARALDISASYLSLIEGGRRPAPDPMLAVIAELLSTSIEALRENDETPDVAIDPDLELELKFAELALRSGDAASALVQFEESSTVAVAAEQVAHAEWGRARCLESIGRLEEAIPYLENLVDGPALPVGVSRSAVTVALSRVYLEAGDVGRAIDLGERVLKDLDRTPDAPDSIDDRVALASSLAGCYEERGDLTRAFLVVTAALKAAEEHGSLQARGSAYWNLGILAEDRGDSRSARHYVDRALALFSESDNQRAVALLRVVSGWLLLRGDTPDPTSALPELERALTDLESCGSSVDRAYAETEIGRAHLLLGDPDLAMRTATQALERLRDDSPVQVACARLLSGHASNALGRTAEALQSFRAAAEELEAAGVQRHAASAWRELAEAFVVAGQTDDALKAYRRATDAVGIRPPAAVATEPSAALRRA